MLNQEYPYYCDRICVRVRGLQLWQFASPPLLLARDQVLRIR